MAPLLDDKFQYAQMSDRHSEDSDNEPPAMHLGMPLKLTYVNKVLQDDPDSHKFTGKPRPELDDAWHKLLDGTLIKFTDEELRQAGNAKSIAHKDGGYVGGLAISHSLHCLDWKELEYHMDHCLESIRQEILCSGSSEVYTLKWTPANKVKPAVTIPQPRMCVDWEALHDWMKGRAANYSDMIKPTDPEYKGEQPV
ncbi:hypothetical protein F4808DRAFT_459906 [Astrocystis sublimbata]|nr:hypothetical protein F4808DRAFT_459906 [Astrocystis sublimbata]